MGTEKIEAPIPGKIIRVEVAQGHKVKEGGILCIIESMKMENPIRTPVNGQVSEVKVAQGDMARSGQLIAVIEY
ncbi:MAG: acetyl-CoA carboxylase biotin carboxyl carrier protein subunit [Chloroflexota bacterium]